MPWFVLDQIDIDHAVRVVNMFLSNPAKDH